jgi:WhiB family transcriptional regulator, redox-sensing transcriptional regulator
MSTDTRRATTNAAPRADWMRDGLCAQTDPALFFPEGRAGAITSQTKQAKSICNRCPVTAECLEWALTTGERNGVWGGVSEAQLRRQTRSGGKRSGVARCVEAQPFIEQRVAEGASHRQIAEELGVAHTAVGRACRLFQSEGQRVQGEQVTAA